MDGVGSGGQRCGEVGWGGVGWGGVGVCVCVCVCVAKPVAVELRCHATALIYAVLFKATHLIKPE